MKLVINDARLSVTFQSHHKTKKLARRLGDAGPLHMIYLILWAAQNRCDGDLSGMSDEDIELAVDWRGESGAFAPALAEVGFLDGDILGRSLHDWETHNPWVAGAKDRSDKARFAGLVSRYGREKADKMFHAGQAKTPNRDNGQSTASQPLVNGELTTRPKVLDSVSLPSPSPSPSPKTPVATLPDWLPKDVWDDYSDHRKAKRAKMTPRAVALLLTSLDKLRLAGNDPRAVLEQSIANGWTGIFALKNGGSNGSQTSRKLSLAEETEAGIKRFNERVAREANT